MVEGTNKLSKGFWIVTFVICLICIAFIGLGCSYYKKINDKEVVKDKSGGEVYFKFVGNTNGLTLLNSSPISDELGMKQDDENKYFDFAVEVDLDKANYVEYEISLEKDNAFSTVSDKDIRFYLEEEKSGTYTKLFGPKEFVQLDKDSEFGTEKGNMILHTGKKTTSGTTNYRLRMWIADNSSISSGNYSVEVSINGRAK